MWSLPTLVCEINKLAGINVHLEEFSKNNKRAPWKLDLNTNQGSKMDILKPKKHIFRYLGLVKYNDMNEKYCAK